MTISAKHVVLGFLIFGACGRLTPTEPKESPVVQPNCANPAPLVTPGQRGCPDCIVDEYVVLLKPNYNPQQEGARLSKTYGFVISGYFSIIPAFSASLHSSTVASLRCEPSVQAIDFADTNIPPP